MKTTRIKIQIPTIKDRVEAEAVMNELALVVNNERYALAKRDAEILAINKKYEGNLAVYAVARQVAHKLGGRFWRQWGGDAECVSRLRTEEPNTKWAMLLSENPDYTYQIIKAGSIAMRYAKNMDTLWLSESWHIIEWEGRKFLAQNSVQRGSGILDSKDVPETGHDALMLYGFRGKYWTVSLYHAAHRTDLDLSEIAKKHGGGGHKGACGFTCKQLPFAL